MSAKSTHNSLSLNNLMGNLSESTETDLTEETSQFYETLQRYQSETQTIQSILNSLYHKIDKSISPSSRMSNKSKNVTVSCEVIKDLQNRLKLLEAENEELSMQMKKFATVSDISSIHPGSQVNSSKFSKQSPNSLFSDIVPPSSEIKINTPKSVHFSTPKNEPNNTSNHTVKNETELQIKYAELVAENHKLKKELTEQKNLNETFQNQQINALQKLLSLANLPYNENADINKEMEKVITHLSHNFSKSQSCNESVYHLKSEIAKGKREISNILNSYKDELFNLRLMTIHGIQNHINKLKNSSSIQSNVQSNVQQNQINLNKQSFNQTNQSKNNISVINQNVKNYSLKSSPNKSESQNSFVLIRGLEELVNALSIHFPEIEKESINDLLYNPRQFAQYINSIRSTLDSKVQGLRIENQKLQNDVSSANNQIKSTTISNDIKRTVRDIMSSINKVSREMQIEHKELLAHLEQ
ncbi:hypothetical protein TRFO_40543 [Tritrichomonas foetus]|uniref:Uncharacterized protein n=1 Tax=Tritrichomonas foetus TaxID=1144522 RepID=A0A1J4J319_9EUKA|nr:hypothetical protein TRFO_40543 [Tritrichomonas foetus]|eukprot:OHS93137.1 hypothetical protein TRFO_40543 [Tritrichomonas foetus]